jgi:hypothetical protein
MDLVRDVLDKQLLDKRGQRLGRVDGILMIVEDDQQPRIAYVEAGSVTQGYRIGQRVGDWVKRLARRWGKMHPNPYRIAWSALTHDERGFRVDIDMATIPTLEWERWLRKYIIDRIPGA